MEGFDFDVIQDFGRRIADSAAEKALNRMVSPLVDTYTKEDVELIVEMDRSIVARLDHSVVYKAANPVEDKAVEYMTKQNVLKFLDQNNRQDLVVYFRFDDQAQTWLERELRDAEAVVRTGSMQTNREPVNIPEMQEEAEGMDGQLDLGEYESNGHHEDT